MNEKLNENIDRFIDHFSKQVNRISSISCEDSETFKKSLFCSLIDALSRSIYPKKHPRDRFVSLINRFSMWAHRDYVSLTHLVRLLQLVPDPAFERLRRYATQKIEDWPNSWELIYLDKDPPRCEVDQHWPSIKEYKTPIQNVTIESLTHRELLYTYRNSLVHELRSPGYGMEFGDENEPFYHELSNIDGAGTPQVETIELVYPVAFFEKISSNILQHLSEYLKVNQLNPYDYYNFGTYWIEGLN